MFTYNRSENAADKLSAPGEAADGPAIRALGQERPQGIQQVRRPARKGSALCAALHSQPVTITYQTHVPEEMYDSGTSLGSNAAWFTFDDKGASRSTPVTELPVGSGDGSGTPGTATLVKSNSGYDAAHRTIEWTVKINPHQAYLKGGTFTDRLDSVGPRCTAGHGSGLELVGDVKDIDTGELPRLRRRRCWTWSTTGRFSRSRSGKSGRKPLRSHLPPGCATPAFSPITGRTSPSRIPSPQTIC